MLLANTTGGIKGLSLNTYTHYSNFSIEYIIWDNEQKDYTNALVFKAPSSNISISTADLPKPSPTQLNSRGVNLRMQMHNKGHNGTQI
jgi:hypothetical protein